MLPLGLAACTTPPLAPDAPADASTALQAPDAVLASVEPLFSAPRLLDLSTAVADAQLRLVPAVATDADAPPTPLRAALQLLGERLEAGDAAAILEAVAGVEAALAALPAEDAEAVRMETDAVRLMLDEVRASVTETTLLR